MTTNFLFCHSALLMPFPVNLVAHFAIHLTSNNPMRPSGAAKEPKSRAVVSIFVLIAAALIAAAVRYLGSAALRLF